MIGIDDDDPGPPLLICVPANVKVPWKDNLVELCLFCKREVHVRPTAISPHRAICVECWAERSEPDDQMLVTKTSIEEALSKIRN